MNPTTLIAGVCFAAAITGTALGGYPDEPGFVRLRVEDKSQRTDTAAIHCASSLNRWNPGDTAWQLIPAVNTDGAKVANTWECRIELAKIPEGEELVEFKFAKGSWNGVEVNGDGGDVSNRSITVEKLKARSGTVMTLEPILGFADQRGTRWTGLAAPGAAQKSTVTGTLDVMDVRSSTLNNTRKVRVWTPPGYGDDANKDRRYAVL